MMHWNRAAVLSVKVMSASVWHWHVCRRRLPVRSTRRPASSPLASCPVGFGGALAALLGSAILPGGPGLTGVELAETILWRSLQEKEEKRAPVQDDLRDTLVGQTQTDARVLTQIERGRTSPQNTLKYAPGACHRTWDLYCLAGQGTPEGGCPEDAQRPKEVAGFGLNCCKPAQVRAKTGSPTPEPAVAS